MTWLVYVSFKETFQSTISSLVNLIHSCQRLPGSFEDSWVLLSCPWSLLTHKEILRKGYAIIMQRRSLCRHCLLMQMQMMPLHCKFVSWDSGITQPGAWKQNVACHTHLVWRTTWTAALYFILCHEDENFSDVSVPQFNLFLSTTEDLDISSISSTWILPLVVVKKKTFTILFVLDWIKNTHHCFITG